MTDLETFLKNDIEGFLFNDLRQMQHPDLKVTFPLVMTAFAGIELFGSLLSTSRLRTDGERYFAEYWSLHLYPSPGVRECGVPLYRLVRHGLAHLFLLKGPVATGRYLPSLHLKRSGGHFYIDAVQLANDLMASYKRCVRHVADQATGNPSAETMAARLKDIAADFVKQSERNDLLGFADDATIASLPARTSTTMSMESATVSLNVGIDRGIPDERGSKGTT